MKGEAGHYPLISLKYIITGYIVRRCDCQMRGQQTGLVSTRLAPDSGIGFTSASHDLVLVELLDILHDLDQVQDLLQADLLLPVRMNVTDIDGSRITEIVVYSGTARTTTTTSTA